MTKHNRAIAQGDILIIPVNAVPEGVRPAVAVDGHYIVAHSETGHHHVIEATRAEVFEAADDAFCLWVKTLGGGAEIVHKRDFDTHAPAVLEPNRVYQIRRQREYVPEGFRRAAD